MDPNMVMASRKRNVAPTILGTFWAGGRCVVAAAAFAAIGALVILFDTVGRPYN